MRPLPTITAILTADGYVFCRDGVRLGVLWRVDAGWVTAARTGRNWRRSQPYRTAALAAYARWGVKARDAITAHETLRDAVAAYETSEVA